MLLDHVGLVLGFWPLRVVGRFAMPLFAWGFAQSWQRTTSRDRLSRRLLLWGLLSQVPYWLLVRDSRLNVILGFWWCAQIFGLIHRLPQRWKLPVLLVGSVTAEFLHFDYGWWLPVQVLLFLPFAFPGHPFWWAVWSGFAIAFSWWSNSVIQLVTVVAPLWLVGYDSSCDSKPAWFGKWAFYLFYPAHLLILGLWRLSW